MKRFFQRPGSTLGRIALVDWFLLLFMAVLYTRQKIMTGKQFSDYLLKGVSNMINLVCLLVPLITLFPLFRK